MKEIIENLLLLNLVFLIIGMKNNESAVFDADPDIQILGSTENVENSVNLVSGIFRLPFGDDRFYLSDMRYTDRFRGLLSDIEQ